MNPAGAEAHGVGGVEQIGADRRAVQLMRHAVLSLKDQQDRRRAVVRLAVRVAHDGTVQPVHLGNVLRFLHDHDLDSLLSAPGGRVGPRLHHSLQFLLCDLLRLEFTDRAAIFQDFQCFCFHFDTLTIL